MVRLKTLARLLEIYALERDIPLVGYGAATFRKRAKERGVEPDECYVLGEPGKREPAAPHLAIEVVLSSWELDKLSDQTRAVREYQAALRRC